MQVTRGVVAAGHVDYTLREDNRTVKIRVTPKLRNGTRLRDEIRREGFDLPAAREAAILILADLVNVQYEPELDVVVPAEVEAIPDDVSTSDDDDVGSDFGAQILDLDSLLEAEEPVLELQRVPAMEEDPAHLESRNAWTGDAALRPFLFTLADLVWAESQVFYEQSDTYGRRDADPKNPFDGDLLEKERRLVRLGFNDIDSWDREYLGVNVTKFGGHFAPPHRGHYGVVKAGLAGGCRAVLVAFNRKILNHLVDQEIALRLWDLYLRTDGFVASAYTDAAQPGDAYIRAYTNAVTRKVVFLTIRRTGADNEETEALDRRMFAAACATLQALIADFDGQQVTVHPDGIATLIGRDLLLNQKMTARKLAEQAQSGHYDDRLHRYGDEEELRGPPLRIVMGRDETADYNVSATQMDTDLDALFGDDGEELTANDDQLRSFCSAFLPEHVVGHFDDDIDGLKRIITDIKQRKNALLAAFPNMGKKAVEGQKIRTAMAHLDEMDKYDNLRAILTADDWLQ